MSTSKQVLGWRATRAILLSTLAACTFACRADEPNKESVLTPVRVRVVDAPIEASATRFSATVEPAARVDVAFKVGGYVREIAQIKADGAQRKLEEGDWVKQGAVLAVVKQDDYAARAAGAQAGVAEASASLKQAELDYERLSKLAKTKTVATAEVDNAKARLDGATARVQAERARAGEAGVSLSDCTLKAPFDGIVLKRAVEVGQLASPGALAFTIADTRRMKVIFGAPDTLLERLKMGADVAVRLDSLGRALTGKISRIAPSADTRSRVFDVQAEIANADDAVKTGMIASLQIPEGPRSEARLALPLTAVVRAPKDPRGFAVYVVDGAQGHEVARVRDVSLGDVIGNRVLVTGGVVAGERVIETGATHVNDNLPVRVAR